MKFTKNILSVTAIACIGVFGLTACDERTQDADATNRNVSHQTMQEAQPAETMSYSPTRETINFWIETWDEPGKLSYVYLQNAEGNMLGYYVLEGLPVSYCAQISPNYRLDDRGSGNRTTTVVPAPANDGAYYGEGNCNTYYGKDATTGAYVEYTAGLGMNVLLFDQPLPQTNGMQPLGPTDAENVDEDAEGIDDDFNE